MSRIVTDETHPVAVQPFCDWACATVAPGSAKIASDKIAAREIDFFNLGGLRGQLDLSLRNDSSRFPRMGLRLLPGPRPKSGAWNGLDTLFATVLRGSERITQGAMKSRQGA